MVHKLKGFKTDLYEGVQVPAVRTGDGLQVERPAGPGEPEGLQGTQLEVVGLAGEGGGGGQVPVEDEGGVRWAGEGGRQGGVGGGQVLGQGGEGAGSQARVVGTPHTTVGAGGLVELEVGELVLYWAPCVPGRAWCEGE